MSPSRIAQPYTPHLTITIVTINIFSTKTKPKIKLLCVCVCVCFINFLGSFLNNIIHLYLIPFLSCAIGEISSTIIIIIIIPCMFVLLIPYILPCLCYFLSHSQLPIIVCGLMIFTFTYIYNRILFSIYDQFN